MKRQQWVTVLGSTGSIGLSTLDVIAQHPDRYRVFALTANSQLEKLADQCVATQAKFAVVTNESDVDQLQEMLRIRNSSAEVLSGVAGLEWVSSHSDVDAVMAAIVGAAGMRPTLAAARAGKRVLLANKETLVLAGALFMQAVREHGAVLLPIDSEHNAIFQSLPSSYQGNMEAHGVSKILLTASGGPFRYMPIEQLQHVTPEQACKHPNWSMGRKISVDSATLMNKGLEVIEAHWLFNAPADQIQVVVHPQSVIHSMVQYKDGSVLAQLGNPDMRTPIAYGLAWPERISCGVAPLDLFAIARLDFEAPDTSRFPCLDLAFKVLNQGGAAAAVLNAANEVAVAAFLSGQIRFVDIPVLIEYALDKLSHMPADSLDALEHADQCSRNLCQQWLSAH